MEGSMGFFEKYNALIMEKIDTLSAGLTSNYAQMVAVIITAAVTLYILWVGYQTLAGKIRTPIQDLMWDLAKFAVILTFVNNVDGYLAFALDAAKDIKNGFATAGDESTWALLDKMWARSQELGEILYKMDDGFVPLTGWGARNMIWLGSGVLMTVTALVFLVADVTIALLSITAPLFIFCLMFGFLRTMFNNWLQLIFSSILTVLFASLIVNISMAFMNDMMTQVKADATLFNLMTVGMMALVAGIISAALVWVAKGFASQIAGVGVDGAIQGMAMMGLGAAGWGAAKSAAGLAGKGAELGKGAGKGFLKGGEAKTNSATEWVGKQAGRAAGVSFQKGKEISKRAIENMKARNNNP
ncbi:type IV secretion system protein [Pseudomonas amygdali]|uniref:type IV secretion system protein n=1 Tax=Pseudomonas amygdali TaxID=47877 RepID=UPI0007605AA9|nr:type IV secretion system protein [Pseudomonas amygdali]KWS54911.1 conjugal transfer protein [Pseudomonas amygdali pv. morsprunorum]POD00973.1 conjugal transfer protein [Pseudomonas avellanae]